MNTICYFNLVGFFFFINYLDYVNNLYKKKKDNKYAIYIFLFYILKLLLLFSFYKLVYFVQNTYKNIIQLLFFFLNVLLNMYNILLRLNYNFFSLFY